MWWCFLALKACPHRGIRSRTRARPELLLRREGLGLPTIKPAPVVFTEELATAGIPGSIGTVADAPENAPLE
ncbi:hypothetical protein IDVR_34090 [Intrasporangium sp. DVR]